MSVVHITFTYYADLSLFPWSYRLFTIIFSLFFLRAGLGARPSIIGFIFRFSYPLVPPEIFVALHCLQLPQYYYLSYDCRPFAARNSILSSWHFCQFLTLSNWHVESKFLPFMHIKNLAAFCVIKRESELGRMSKLVLPWASMFTVTYGYHMWWLTVAWVHFSVSSFSVVLTPTDTMINADSTETGKRFAHIPSTFIQCISTR